jgi:hypothetical protein
MLVSISHLGTFFQIVVNIVTVWYIMRRVIRYRRIMWLGHIARMLEEEMDSKIWIEIVRETRYL